MKKYAALSAATLLLVAFLLSLPALVRQVVTPVELIRPSVREISEDIYVSGTVEAQGSKEVYVQLPLVPGEVNVEVGDRVEANQVLARVDTAATRAALFQLVEAAEIIPEEYVSAMGSISEYADLSVLEKLGVGEAAVERLIPSEILSPASGIVTALSLVPGAIAQPGATACTISQMEELRVRLSVEEAYAEQVQPGDRVVFKSGATGDVKFVGTVSKLFPTANKTLVGTSQKTMVGLYAAIEGGANRLKPGYTVNGVVKKESGQTALCVPYEAVLQDDENQEYVYVCENARAVRRNVTTGEEFASGVAVTEGLLPTDLVVADASATRENSLLRWN